MRVQAWDLEAEIQRVMETGVRDVDVITDQVVANIDNERMRDIVRSCVQEELQRDAGRSGRS